jgi:hypothetical protein
MLYWCGRLPAYQSAGRCTQVAVHTVDDSIHPNYKSSPSSTLGALYCSELFNLAVTGHRPCCRAEISPLVMGHSDICRSLRVSQSGLKLNFSQKWLLKVLISRNFFLCHRLLVDLPVGPFRQRVSQVTPPAELNSSLQYMHCRCCISVADHLHTSLLVVAPRLQHVW